jgi:hypothetical protein
MGSALILHSAYSLLHYRELLQELQDSSVGSSATAPAPSSTGAGDLGYLSQPPDLPADVLIEVFLGFVSLLVSEMVRPASALRPVSIAASSGTSGDSKRNQAVAPVYVSRDFDVYSTRAKVL